MTLQIPSAPLFLLAHFYHHGYEAYIVGGAVRDTIVAALTGAPPPTVDFDLTTNATPEQMLAILPNSFYQNQFGTVSITATDLRLLMGLPATQPDKTPIDQAIALSQATKVHASLTLPTPSIQRVEKNIEITTFRAEGGYQDHRRPSQIIWGKDLADDLSRRDFTINAMALQIPSPTLFRLLDDPVQDGLVTLNPGDYTLVDLFGGMKDLAVQRLQTVGQAHERFAEDALRMLRAIRFSAQLNISISPEILSAITAQAPDIAHISWERIRDELLKMLVSPHPKTALELLDQTGLLTYVLPEIQEGKGVTQGGHHTTDVWTHSLDALATCPSADPIVRLATLLHDVAKPRTCRQSGGTITFYNHEVIGARMAKSIGQRLRLSKKECDRLFLLVRHHMFYYQPHNTDAAIRRFMRKIGLENLNDILDLREADRLGSGAKKTSWRLEEMKQRMIEQLHQPFAITDLAIDGHDLMSELGMTPGRKLGDILKHLFEDVSEHPEKNQRNILLEMAQTLLTSSSAAKATTIPTEEQQ